MTETESLLAAIQNGQEILFALGCALAFGLGWIAGHQR